MAGKFYAVKVGKTPGIYNSWDDCKAQTDGFSGAVYKSFKTAAEAAEFMGWGQSLGSKDSIKETSSDGKIIDTEIALENVAYVDGSYNVATGEFSYGVVMFHNGQEHTFSKSFADSELATMRNVAGEIKGAEFVLNYCREQGIGEVEIYYDYEGIAAWAEGRWKTNKNGTIAYKKLFDEISKSVAVTFVKVKGHSGDTYNDMADRLAKDALGIK